MTDPAYLAAVEAAGYTVLRDATTVRVDPAAVRLLPRESEALALQVSGDVLLVAMAQAPTPAQVAALERTAGMALTIAIADDAVLQHLRAASAPLPGEGPRVAAAALSTAAALAASDLTLIPGRAPHAKVAAVTAPLERFARLSASDVLEAAQWLLGEAVAGVSDAVTVGDTRWRVTSSSVRGTLTLALHRLPAAPPRLEELALPAAVGDAVDAAHGLILIASPAGGGRTSTAAALLDRINSSQPVTVVTLEDPVEFQHRPRRAHVVQQQLGRDVATLEAGLQAAAAYGADVVVLDVVDEQSARAALDQAGAGRRVIATIAATSASGALRRLVRMFPSGEQADARADLAATLVVVSAQQLVLSATGQLAVAEVLTATTATRELVRAGRWHEGAAAFDSDPRATTMDRSLALYVAAGRLEVDAARACVSDRESFETYLAHAPGAPTARAAATTRSGDVTLLEAEHRLPQVTREGRRAARTR